MSNQRAIAEALGVSQSAVALALRGSPRISRTMRERVQEAAARMGYRANPMVATLMQHVRSGTPLQNHGSIAILVSASSGAKWDGAEPYRLHYEGFLKRAKLRGFKTETFFLRSCAMSYEKINSILMAQGFSGVIVAVPEIRDETGWEPVVLQWDRLACVTISYERSYLPCDRVSTDHYDNASLAYRKAQERGYRRIGLALSENALNPHDRNWLAGYLACTCSLPEACRIPVFIGDIKRSPAGKFQAWHARWKPDALLCLMGEEIQWLRQLGLSPRNDLPLVCLNRPKNSDFSGVDEDNLAIGELACDVVIGHIYRNERGFPEVPRLILAKGNWVEGKTFPIPKRRITGA